MVSNVTLHQLLLTTTITGVPSMTFKLFYNYQTIEPYYQLISYLLKYLHPVIWLLLLMSMDSINHRLHVLKVIVLFFPYKVLMLDNTVKEYIVLMFTTDLQQHSPSLTENMITKTINKLYAMMLPPSCKVVLVYCRTNITVLRHGGMTDLKYSTY